LLYCRRTRKIGDGLYPGWQGAYARGGKAVAEKIDRAAGEEALLWINNQPVLLQDREDRLQVEPVGFLVWTGDEDIVQVHEGER
jgi:hypothetical protein